MSPPRAAKPRCIQSVRLPPVSSGAIQHFCATVTALGLRKNATQRSNALRPRRRTVLSAVFSAPLFAGARGPAAPPPSRSAIGARAGPATSSPDAPTTASSPVIVARTGPANHRTHVSAGRRSTTRSASSNSARAPSSRSARAMACWPGAARAASPSAASAWESAPTPARSTARSTPPAALSPPDAPEVCADSDGDGIGEAWDDCPETAAGVPTGADGCEAGRSAAAPPTSRARSRSLARTCSRRATPGRRRRAQSGSCGSPRGASCPHSSAARAYQVRPNLVARRSRENGSAPSSAACS